MLPLRARVDLRAKAMEVVLRIPQSSSITGALLTDYLVSYPGHCLEVSPRCWVAVGLFNSPSRLGYGTLVGGITHMQLKPTTPPDSRWRYYPSAADADWTTGLSLVGITPQLVFVLIETESKFISVEYFARWDFAKCFLINPRKNFLISVYMHLQ